MDICSRRFQLGIIVFQKILIFSRDIQATAPGKEKDPKYSLYLQAQFMYGLTVVLQKQGEYLLS